jgi:hypothetical protein
MKKIFLFLFFAIVCVPFLNAADVVLKYIQPQDNPLTLSFMWEIKVNKIIRPDRFLRLSFIYTIEDKKSEVSFILPPKPPLMNYDSIMFSVTTSDQLDTTVYIYALARKKHFTVGHRETLEGSRYNVFGFKYLPELNLDIGREAVLVESCKDIEASKGFDYRGRSFPLKDPKTFEPFILKAKAELVDSQKMYMHSQTRPDTKGLSDKEALKALTIHRDNIEKDYRGRFATLDDLFLAQSFLVEVDKKIRKLKPVKSKLDSKYIYIHHIRQPPPQPEKKQEKK